MKRGGLSLNSELVFIVGSGMYYFPMQIFWDWL